jgi:hypothetical protein
VIYCNQHTSRRNTIGEGRQGGQDMLWSQRFGAVTRLLLFQEEEGGKLKKEL